MAVITYEDKNNTLPTSNPRRNFRDQDANEIKNVVNQNATAMGYKAVPFEPASAPEDAQMPVSGGTGNMGIPQEGNRWRFTSAGYIPGADGPELWPKGTILEAFADNPGNDPEKWRAY